MHSFERLLKSLAQADEMTYTPQAKAALLRWVAEHVPVPKRRETVRKGIEDETRIDNGD